MIGAGKARGSAGSTERLARYQVLLTILCTAVVLLSTVLIYRQGLLNRIDYLLYDLHYKWRGPRTPAGDIVLVLMDKASAEELGRMKSSWSRRHMAAALNHLCAAGAEVIGLDLIFMAPDSDPGADAALAAAMDGCNNIVLARGSSTHGGELVSIDRFQEMTIGDGFIDFFLDEDEVLRRIRYLNARPLPDGGLELLPSFALELARTFLYLDFQFDFSSGEAFLLGGADQARLRLPQPELIVNFPGNYTAYPTLSFADAATGRFPASAVRGKLVIVGSSLATEKDVFSTAYTRFQAPDESFEDRFGAVVQDILAVKDLGVACHAHGVDTLLSGTFIRRVSVRQVIVLTVFLGIAGVLFYLPKFHMTVEMLVLAAAVAGVLGASHWLFLERRLWLDAAPLLTVLILQYVAGMGLQKVFSRRKTAFITDLFGRYVSHGVVDELIKGTVDLTLEGRRAELTILFSDLRGFTTISEGLGAKPTGDLLNVFFSNMIPIVFKHGGTLDKLMGDAIMAFFGAPAPLANHPVRAAETALEMLERLREMRREAAVPGIDRLRLGVGLNTDEVTVGNLGSNDFMDYTVIGDGVNLASRLEGLNKEYGTEIIVSEHTARKLGDRFLLRELDKVRVKGKEQAVTLYELMGDRERLADFADAERLLTLFTSGLRAYRDRRWDEAIREFQGALEIAPGDGPSALYMKRIEEVKNLSLDTEWDWVKRYDHK